MAWSSAALAASETTYLTADKPLLATLPLLSSDGISAKWSNDYDGTWADTDIAQTTGKAINALDGCTHVTATPTLASMTHTPGVERECSLIINCSASPVEFDSLAVFNHNNYSPDSLPLFDVFIADDSAFTSNKQKILSITSWTANTRRTFLTLDHTATAARRYSGVPYIRVSWYWNFSSTVAPIVGELAFMRRRQLYHKSNNPWDPDAMSANVERFESASGVVRDTVFHQGRRHVQATFTIPSGTEQTEALAVFTGGGYGTRTFAWVDLPSSAPNSVMLLKHTSPGTYGAPYINWQARQFTIDAVEQGPHFLADGAV